MPIDYLVLDEALQGKLARVTEVSEGGSVPELAFENFADQGVLLLDGEELVGNGGQTTISRREIHRISCSPSEMVVCPLFPPGLMAALMEV